MNVSDVILSNTLPAEGFSLMEETYVHLLVLVSHSYLAADFLWVYERSRGLLFDVY